MGGVRSDGVDRRGEEWRKEVALVQQAQSASGQLSVGWGHPLASQRICSPL